jgi:hypothetical protein
MNLEEINKIRKNLGLEPLTENDRTSENFKGTFSGLFKYNPDHGPCRYPDNCGDPDCDCDSCGVCMVRDVREGYIDD